MKNKILIALMGSMLLQAGLVNAVGQDKALESAQITSIPSLQTTSDLWKPKEDEKQQNKTIEQPNFIGIDLQSRADRARQKRINPEYTIYAAIKNHNAKKIKELIEGGADLNMFHHPKNPKVTLYAVAETYAVREKNPVVMQVVLTSVRPNIVGKQPLDAVVKTRMARVANLKAKGINFTVTDDELRKQIEESYARAKASLNK